MATTPWNSRTGCGWTQSRRRASRDILTPTFVASGVMVRRDVKQKEFIPLDQAVAKLPKNLTRGTTPQVSAGVGGPEGARPAEVRFLDPWGNHIQVVDLHDESLVWLLPYGEVQKAGVKFDAK